MTPETIAVYVTFALTVVLGALQANARQGEKERDRQIGEVRKTQAQLEVDQRAIAERLRLDELETVRLDGRMKLAEQIQAQASSAMAEVRDTMVHRREFEASVSGINSQLHEMMSMLRQGIGHRGRVSSESDPRAPAVRP